MEDDLSLVVASPSSMFRDTMCSETQKLGRRALQALSGLGIIYSALGMKDESVRVRRLVEDLFLEVKSDKLVVCAWFLRNPYSLRGINAEAKRELNFYSFANIINNVSCYKCPRYMGKYWYKYALNMRGLESMVNTYRVNKETGLKGYALTDITSMSNELFILRTEQIKTVAVACRHALDYQVSVMHSNTELEASAIRLLSSLGSHIVTERVVDEAGRMVDKFTIK